MGNDGQFTYDLSDAGKYGFKSLKAAADPENSLRYFFDDLRIGPYLSQLPGVLADLVDVASAVSWADRISLRSRAFGSFIENMGWARTINITIGVRQPHLWSKSDVKDQLEDLLSWLTGDTWNLSFSQLDGIRRPSDVAVQSSLFSPPKNTSVVLFSGGLDSLAGVVRLLETEPSKHLLLVSAVSARLSGVTSSLASELRAISPQITYAPFPFYLVKHRHSKYQTEAEKASREEHSQRTRGFLFFTFAAAAAVAYGASEVITLENGVGAVNLPTNWAQLGPHTSRSVHPKTLNMMGRLISALGLDEIQFRGPNFKMTKGELCNSLVSSRARSLIRFTVSCDNFPLRVKRFFDGAELHCGKCTSCTFRRIALHAAKLESGGSNSRYATDITQPRHLRQLSTTEPVKMLLDQAATINELYDTPDPTSNMLTTFPELVTAIQAIMERPAAFGFHGDGHQIASDLCDAYRRYAVEWQTFPLSL